MSKNTKQAVNDNDELLTNGSENNNGAEETKVHIDENLINSLVEAKVKEILKENQKVEQATNAKTKVLDTDSTQSNGYYTPEQTGKILEKQAKEKIKIMVDSNNKNFTHEEVKINGYRYLIEKGKEVEVPKQVATILKEAGII